LTTSSKESILSIFFDLIVLQECCSLIRPLAGPIVLGFPGFKPTECPPEVSFSENRPCKRFPVKYFNSGRYSRVPGHRNHQNDPASVFLSTYGWSQHPACQRWLLLVVSCFYKTLTNCHPNQRVSKEQCRKPAKKYFYIEISCRIF